MVWLLLLQPEPASAIGGGLGTLALCTSYICLSSVSVTTLSSHYSSTSMANSTNNNDSVLLILIFFLWGGIFEGCHFAAGCCLSSWMMTDEWIKVLVACAGKMKKFDQQDVVVVVADHSHSTITMKLEPRQTKNNETKSPYYSVAQSLLFCGWLAATVVVGRTVTATTVCGGGADSTLICHCVRVQQQQVSPFVAFSHFAPHSGRSSVRPFALLALQIHFSRIN